MTKDESPELETIEASTVVEISEFCEMFNCLPDEALRQQYKLMTRIHMYRKHKARFEEEKRQAEARNKPKQQKTMAPRGAKPIRGARRRR